MCEKYIFEVLFFIIRVLQSYGQGLNSDAGLKLGSYGKSCINFSCFKHHIFNLLSAEKKTFYLSKILLPNWISAYSFCYYSNMTMVTLETSTEAQEFAKLLKQQTFADTINIGGTADSERVNWHWYQTGKQIPFRLLWATNYPTDVAYADCLALNRLNGFVNVPCYEPGHHFSCQKEEK